MPDRDDVVSYIEQAGGDVREHDLVRAFGVKGRDRFRLKQLLRDLEGDGSPRPRGRRSRAPPSVAVLDVAALDQDGEPLARLASEPEDAAPRIRLLAGDGRAPAPAVGDRVLA
ncbi:MAG TPA: hypothetical protein VE597_06540, partial [Geminicoccaceae bacterium]|nr:hypothetical protein [Geminicoccaceae bacterium]